MKNLQSTKVLVKSILEADEKARNSDSFLYFRLLERIDKALLTVPVHDFLLGMGLMGIPSFETVRRTRQKVQAECPWLAASSRVAKHRAENEEIYRNFARG
jgi:hypothetical protein